MPKLKLGRKVRTGKARPLKLATNGQLNTFAQRAVKRVKKFTSRVK